MNRGQKKAGLPPLKFTDIEPFLTDYRSIDSGMRDLVDKKRLFELINMLEIEPKVRHCLIKIYEKIAYVKDQSFLILNKIPRTEEGSVDLRILEGGGFYQNIDGNWLYHKGGGSIEALAIEEKLSIKNLIYPAYGAEHSNHLGLFLGKYILGIKDLGQAIHEFCSALACLIHYIKINNCYSAEDVLGNCTIPLGIVTLPLLTQTMYKHLNEKPEHVAPRYTNRPNANQAAKNLMLVPGPIRATDNYAVDGKWTESLNVYIRTLSLGPCELHSYQENIYWDPYNSEMRSNTLKILYNVGFTFMPISAHLQNLYAVPVQNNCKKKPFLAADYSDLLPLDELENHEIRTLMFNVLSGWRIAESMGPSILPDINNNYLIVEQNITAYFKGFLDNDFRSDLAKLYLLLPHTIILVIVDKFIERQSRNLDIAVWHKAMDYLDENFHANEIANEFILHFKENEKNIFSKAVNLRPLNLISLIYNGIYENKFPENYDLLLKIATNISAAGESNKIHLYPTNALCVEIIFHMNINISYYLNRLASDPTQAWSIYTDLLNNKFNLKSSDEIGELIDFIANTLEECFYKRYYYFRRWIMLSLGSNETILKSWINGFLTVSSVLMESAYHLLNDYLGFLFKRNNLLEYFLENTNEAIIERISGKWKLEEVPIMPSYPKIILRNDLRQILEKGVKKNEIKNSYISIMKYLYNFEI